MVATPATRLPVRRGIGCKRISHALTARELSSVQPSPSARARHPEVPWNQPSSRCDEAPKPSHASDRQMREARLGEADAQDDRDAAVAALAAVEAALPEPEHALRLTGERIAAAADAVIRLHIRRVFARARAGGSRRSGRPPRRVAVSAARQRHRRRAGEGGGEKVPRCARAGDCTTQTRRRRSKTAVPDATLARRPRGFM
jgi:hypothetical protein